MQYCSLQHRTLLLSPVTSTLGIVFALAPSLRSFWSYFSTDLQYHIGHLLTWGVPLSVSYHFAFSYCSWGSQARILKWLPFPSPVDHILSDLSTMTGPSWVAPRAWLSFIELDKGLVRVIKLTSFLWLWFVCLSSDASCNTYHLTLISLTLNEGYVSMAAPAKHSHCSLPWMSGISSPHSWGDTAQVHLNIDPDKVG